MLVGSEIIDFTVDEYPQHSFAEFLFNGIKRYNYVTTASDVHRDGVWLPTGPCTPLNSCTPDIGCNIRALCASMTNHDVF